jgi:hypothetical protein
MSIKTKRIGTFVVTTILVSILLCFLVYFVFFNKKEYINDVNLTNNRRPCEKYVPKNKLYLTTTQDPTELSKSDQDLYNRFDMLGKKYSLNDGIKIVQHLQQLLFQIPSQLVANDETHKLTIEDASTFITLTFNNIIRTKIQAAQSAGDAVTVKVIESFFKQPQIVEPFLPFIDDIASGFATIGHASKNAFWNTTNADGGECGHGQFMKGLFGCKGESAPLIDAVVKIPTAFAEAGAALANTDYSGAFSSATRAVLDTDFKNAFSNAYTSISDIDFKKAFSMAWENVKRSLSILDGRNVDKLMCQFVGVTQLLDFKDFVQDAKSCYTIFAKTLAKEVAKSELELGVLFTYVFGPVVGPVVATYYGVYSTVSQTVSCVSTLRRITEKIPDVLRIAGFIPEEAKVELVKKGYDTSAKIRAASNIEIDNILKLHGAKTITAEQIKAKIDEKPGIASANLTKVHQGDMQARHCGHPTGALADWIHPNKTGSTNVTTFELANCSPGKASDLTPYLKTGTSCSSNLDCCSGEMGFDIQGGSVSDYRCRGVTGSCLSGKCQAPETMDENCKPTLVSRDNLKHSFLGCSMESLDSDNKWVYPEGGENDYKATGRPLPVMFPPIRTDYGSDGKYLKGGVYNERTFDGDIAMYNYRMEIGDNIYDIDERMKTIIDGTCGPR